MSNKNVIMNISILNKTTLKWRCDLGKTRGSMFANNFEYNYKMHYKN